MTGRMADLILQLGILIFAVRAAGALAKKCGGPAVLGELLVGMLIGPFALGGLALPGFPAGLFPVASASFPLSPELYGFATLASVILLFSAGLETDLLLFLRYSVTSILIGASGVIFSFAGGVYTTAYFLGVPPSDPRCLFLGVLAVVTSVSISARILSDLKKIDSTEGVTILGAAVFDDLLGIVMLALIMGMVEAKGRPAGFSGLGGSTWLDLALVAFKVFGISISVIALGLLFSKKLANFLKLFKNSYDFSILSIGIALLVTGLFEKQGVSLIIGAYTAGLALSKMDVSMVIQDRIRGLYEFFVPIFFALTGMLIDVRAILVPQVLLFGAVYTLVACVTKVAGCALPALALGFNRQGAMRIGLGMIPRGEVALVIAGTALAAGIINKQLFGVVVLMTLVSTMLAPALLSLALKRPGSGTRKQVKGRESLSVSWDFPSSEIADLVVDSLLKDLRQEGFYVQMMNVDEGLSQARKGQVALSITELEHQVTIETSPEDLWFVKTAVFEVIVKLDRSIERLKTTSNPALVHQDEAEVRSDGDLLNMLDPECVSLKLRGETKEEIISELAGLLLAAGKISDRILVADDVIAREKTMSTGMQHGVALPHAKTTGTKKLCVAVGLKPDGLNFDSIDGEKSRIFVMMVSPKKSEGPHIQFLSLIGSVLKKAETREKLLQAHTQEEAVEIIRQGSP